MLDLSALLHILTKGIIVYHTLEDIIMYDILVYMYVS